MPFSANEVFQILGRAGRPGLDSVGYGIILTETLDERDWVESHYFAKFSEDKAIPRYNKLKSGLNRIYTLKEQVLLRIFEEKKLTLEQLKEYFEKTYFYYCVKEQMAEQKIPIDQLLMIQEILTVNLLKLHSQPQKVKAIKEKQYAARISELSSKSIAGMVKTDYGVYNICFDLDLGIQCSCGFENGVSDHFADKKFSFEFCDHVTALLIYLIDNKEPRIKKYVDDIVPKAAKNQYGLNYLFEKGLIKKSDDGTIKCSQFGKLII